MTKTMTNNGRVIKNGCKQLKANDEGNAMPYYYKGQVVTKEIWDTISPELKKKIVMEGSKRMDYAKVNGLFVVLNEFGVDRTTGRLMVLLRCDIEGSSTFYASASCKELDMKTMEPKDFRIEFLENATWAIKNVAYNADLFKGILDMSTEVFLEIITDNEAATGA